MGNSLGMLNLLYDVVSSSCPSLHDPVRHHELHVSLDEHEFVFVCARSPVNCLVHGYMKRTFNKQS